MSSAQPPPPTQNAVIPWEERLQECAYISPNGTRTVLTYRNVSRSRKKKTTEFVYGDADGSYVQDRGVGGYRYPMEIYFNGPDHDVQADNFEALLGNDRGIGVLEHARYGSVYVVVFGDIKQEDRLVTQANQTTITVTFFQTNRLVYPTTQDDPVQQLTEAIPEHTAAFAVEMEEIIDTEEAGSKTSLRERFNSILARTKDVFDEMTKTVADVRDNINDVRRTYNRIYRSVSSALDTLIGQPITLAYQTIALIQAPARAVLTRIAIFEGWGNLIEGLFEKETYTIGIKNNAENDFKTDDLISSASISAVCLAVTNADFVVASEALKAAEQVLDLFDQYTEWRDRNLQSLNILERGDSYYWLQKIVTSTAANLVLVSINLKRERWVTLDRARSPVDLCGQYYDDVEDSLDLLITSNNLTGREFFEIPAGREIVIYV